MLLLYKKEGTMKQCNKCKELRAENEYKKDPRNASGLQGICKPCNKAWQQKRRNEISEGVNLKIVSNKKCNKCKIIKEINNFYKDTGGTDGHHTLCKPCRNITMSKWRDNNREKYNDNMREFRANNKEWAKNTDLMRCYGITLEDYKRMCVEQDNKCKICKKAQKGIRPLVVDHDHATGEVRGLLCYGCNRRIVSLDNDPLKAAMEAYLKKA